MPGAIYEAFDVVVVPLPFTDRTAAKRRPAMVVSTATFNRTHNQLILAMITSASGNDWPSDVRLQDWSCAGLTVPCRLRLKLFALDQALVLRRLGQLAGADQAAVRRALSASLAVA